MDHEGKIVEFNPAAERTFGYRRANAIGQQMAELIVPPALRESHALGLANHVVMTGFRRDVPEVMAALDLLVLPSTRSEATSQVIPQALAVRTPVVATAVGGIPEIVKDGVTGRLVPPGEPDALARAIVEMISDTERAHIMAQAGQALVRERFTVDAMMAATTRVYASLLR